MMIKRIVVFFLFLPSLCFAAAPIISDMPDTTASAGTTYTASPSATGDNITWWKEYGPDACTVDSSTGAVSWAIPSGLPNESFYIGVAARNDDGVDYDTWIVTVGGTVYRCGSGETYTTIDAMTAVMSSGDTGIIKAGTYTGTSDRLYNDGGSHGTWPPNGDSTKYTTIMAENPGTVFLDGENARVMIYAKGNYVSFDNVAGSSSTIEYIAVKGIVAGRSSASGAITYSHTSHMKLMHCGSYDQKNDSGAAINLVRCGYTLIESCYIYGMFREAIMHWISEYTIIRRCVARRDGNDSHEPLGGYVHYASRDSHIQSSIIIDFDRTDYITDQTYTAGAFESDCGGSCGEADRQIRHLYNHSCLSLNTDDRTAALSQPTALEEYTTPEWTNIVVWDQRMWWNGVEGSQYPGSAIRSKGDSLWNQCTFGELSSPLGSIEDTEHQAFFNGLTDGTAAGDSIKNSIFYNFTDYDTTAGDVSTSFVTLDYNDAYGVGVVSKQSNDTNTITINPNFKYITRLETSSPLLTAGESGARVGADLTYMRGASGTLYGETGYDSDTTTPMWPFPGEHIMQKNMRAYSYDNGNLTGARGFCAEAKQLNGVDDMTLTSYVWEYLGNEIPENIYGFHAGGSPLNGNSQFHIGGNSTITFK